MGAAREWYGALAPALRELMREKVLCLAQEPTDAQIAELPEIVKPSWKLDAIRIEPSQQESVRAAIADLAAKLRAEKRAKR